MGELLAQLMTPELQMALTVIVVFLVIIYVLCIVWVARDAYIRDTKWVLWAIVALIPILGVIAYCLLRPPLYQIDRDEQELEIAIKQRELMKYGECGRCGYPVEADFVLCPNCHARLKNLCPTCHHALDPEWTVCPYCTTPVGGAPHAQQRNPQTRTRTREAEGNPARDHHAQRQARPRPDRSGRPHEEGAEQ